MGSMVILIRMVYLSSLYSIRKHIHFSDQTADEVTARVSVNQMAMRKWALQYATNVRVLSPEDLVDEIKEDIHQAFKNYQY